MTFYNLRIVLVFIFGFVLVICFQNNCFSQIAYNPLNRPQAILPKQSNTKDNQSDSTVKKKIVKKNTSQNATINQTQPDSILKQKSDSISTLFQDSTITKKNNLASIGGAPGKITGKVINAKTGEPLSGATIGLKSGDVTKSINTDYNGVYTLGGIPEGTYSLTCTFISYAKKNIEDIKIIKGDVTVQDITMQESKGKEMQDIVIKSSGSTRNKESVVTMLVMQKNSASVSDGISAEAIKRTPDKTTSDIMKRVSGASIQEDKFVIIRGLNDRYNAAFINNAPLPSSESDRKAFSFDVFPANMLDNLVIVKTATPDMPAEFAGGLIFINTKDIPTKDFQSFSFGLGYNTQATFHERRFEKPGRWDWVGLDDGIRALSPNIPSKNLSTYSFARQGQIGKNLSNNWADNTGVAPPNYNFQYAKGINIQKKQKDYLGVLFAATYNKTFNLFSNDKNSYNGLNIDNEYSSKFSGNTYSTQILSGLMANVALKINSNNKISFKNLLSINTEDRIINNTGDPEFPSSTRSALSAKWFTSNVVLSSQLSGEHFWTKTKLKINWTGGYTSSDREIPNLKKMGRTYTEGDPDNFTQSVSSKFSISNHEASGSIFTSSTKESIKSLGADIVRSIKINNFNNIQFKTGIYIQGRERDFSARYLSIIQLDSFPLPFDASLLKLQDDKIFAPGNFGKLKNGKYGFGLSEDFNPDNEYSASSFLNAYYLMMDTRLLKFIRINGGLRVEEFNQKLSSASNSVNTTIKDNLPSVNLILSLNSKQNLRFSYSQSLNRPEYRELAPFIFYDYVTRLSVFGNTKLERVKIDNYDARYELYPGKGQLLSVSYFQKILPNPIEFVINPNSDATYINAQEGKISGVELEWRAVLGALFKAKSRSVLNRTTLFGNLAFINSSVTFGKDSITYGGKRALQGQSPYIYNAGLTYQDDKGYSGTIQLNYSAPRIFIGGGTDNAAIVEDGRNVLDLQFAKNFEKDNIELKINVKDILSPSLVQFYDMNANGKFEDGIDKIFAKRSSNTVISASLTYKF